MSLIPPDPWPLTSFIAVLLALPLLIRLAPRLGLLDRPDARKRHRGEVPLVGGLALFVGLAVAYLVNHYGDARLAFERAKIRDSSNGVVGASFEVRPVTVR